MEQNEDYLDFLNNEKESFFEKILNKKTNKISQQGSKILDMNGPYYYCYH